MIAISTRPGRTTAGVVAALVLMVTAGPSSAEDVYQAPGDFVAEVFSGDVPEPEVVWITKSIKQQVIDILGHRPPSRRLRYWRRDERTVWILGEIGKVKPITTGIVVDAGSIEALKVLIYRESRGWEVRYPFFTNQFRGAALRSGLRLDRSIDGISGATLSVQALVKLARLALYLHHHVTKQGNG